MVVFSFFFLTSMLTAGDPGEKRSKGVAGGILVAIRSPSLAGKPLQLLTEMTETEGVRNTNTMELMILIH